MKKLVALVVTMISAAGIAASDPLEGIWQTEVESGGRFAHVTISPCGDAFCGVISRTFDDRGEAQTEYIGRQIVMDMIPQAGGGYAGRVWRLSNDKVYDVTMTVLGSRLQVRGCVAGGLFCANQHWLRVQ